MVMFFWLGVVPVPARGLRVRFYWFLVPPP